MNIRVNYTDFVCFHTCNDLPVPISPAHGGQERLAKRSGQGASSQTVRQYGKTNATRQWACCQTF
jgi:hypothetical protein